MNRTHKIIDTSFNDYLVYCGTQLDCENGAALVDEFSSVEMTEEEKSIYNQEYVEEDLVMV